MVWCVLYEYFAAEPQRANWCCIVYVMGIIQKLRVGLVRKVSGGYVVRKGGEGRRMGGKEGRGGEERGLQVSQKGG